MRAVLKAVRFSALKNSPKGYEMTPPKVTVTGNSAGITETPSAVSVRLVTLRNRPDFLRAARAARRAMPGFVLQFRQRVSDEINPHTIRCGFTCSKKVGNAVARNRAKRRLRAIARDVLPKSGQPGWDYVLIGRANKTADHPYGDMVDDLTRALERIHGETT